MQKQELGRLSEKICADVLPKIPETTHILFDQSAQCMGFIGKKILLGVRGTSVADCIF